MIRIDEVRALWDANFAAWQSAKSEYDAAAKLHDDDYAAATADKRSPDQELGKRVDALATPECDTRMALVLTPAPDFLALQQKMNILFGPSQFSELGAEDQYGNAWHRRFTDAVLADMARLQSEFAEAWLAAWTHDGGSVVIDDEGKAQIGWPVYDLSPNYRAPDAAWPQEVRDNAFLQGQAMHDATMKARYEALRMVPGGVAMLKAHMSAKGVRVAIRDMEQGK